jgi:hypothetical protein
MTTSTSRDNPADDPAAMFFDELGRRGREPLLRKVSGRVRFDLVDGAHTEQWLVAVDKGELTVRARLVRPTARSAANAHSSRSWWVDVKT